MTALDLCSTWPVDYVAAAVIEHRSDSAAVVATYGQTDRAVRIASLSKPLAAWAMLVATEEGLVDLDVELDAAVTAQPSCSLRHLLSHAGGYPFDGTTPISRPERTRIYSNGGIELAASVVATESGMAFEHYLQLGLFEPLGMDNSSLHGSPAHQVRSTVDDLALFLTEAQAPVLISQATATDAISIQFPTLSGIVPGVGRYSQCPWGLGFEVRGDKSPHWTGARNTAQTYGHFGGAGTMMWTDPSVGLSLIALTDRPFDEWSGEALHMWPALSDAVIEEFAVHSGQTE